jgi:hypothetical protein
MEPEGSSPHSQAPATCPYPEPAQSSPHTPIPTNCTTPTKNSKIMAREIGGEEINPKSSFKN